MMRDYGTISPKFWTQGTGKALRGNLEAQLVALYLMSSPHSTSIGIFNCPLVYIAHETGLAIEGASKGLRSLIEADFCRFDDTTDEVFVLTMASYQVAEVLDPKDKRCGWVRKELEKVASAQLRFEFAAIYSVAFNLPNRPPKVSPFEAPSKPLPSQEQEQEQEQEREAGDVGFSASPSARPPPVSKNSANRGSRLPNDWRLSESGRAFVAGERPDLDPGAVAAAFADHWRAMPGRDGVKLDWEAAWRNWVRKERTAAPALRPLDVARSTTPGRRGIDPELARINAEAQKAVKPSPEVLAQIAALGSRAAKSTTAGA